MRLTWILKASLITLCFWFGLNLDASAQWMLINQNGGNPDSSAALEVSDTTRGLLIPRLTDTQMNAIASPAEGLLIYNSDSLGFFFYDSTNTVWQEIATLGSSAQDLFDVLENGNDALGDSIVGIGRLGIGTSSPTADLHVQDTVAVVRIRSTDTNWTRIQLVTPTSHYQFIGGFDTSKFTIKDQLRNAPRLVIDSSGYVGIGTTDPKGPLEVHGDSPALITRSFNGDGNTTRGVLQLKRAYTNGPGSDGIGAQMVLYAETTTEGVSNPIGLFRAETTDATTDSIDSDISLVPYNNGVAMTNAFKINSSGNVGIGTNTPEVKLHIQGQDNVTSSTSLLLRSTATNRAARITFDKANNGETTVGNHNFGGIFARAYTGSQYESAASIVFSGDGLPAVNDLPAKITFNTTAAGDSIPAERVRINSAGNVGIGTTSPTDALTITGPAGSGNLVLKAQSIDPGDIIFQDSAGTQYGRIWADGNRTLKLSSADITTDLIIDSIGNVGIGNTTPLAPLHFATDTASRKIVLWQSPLNDNNHQFLGFGVTMGELRYQTGNSGDDHVFYSGINSSSSMELMRIDGTGNVGIGTSSPQEKLVVQSNGGVNRLVMKTLTNASTNYLYLDRARGGETIMGSGSTFGVFGARGFDGTNYIPGAEIAFVSDGTLGTNDMPGRITFGTTADGASSVTERMRITSDGSVAIGTTTPLYDLHVQRTGLAYIGVESTGASNAGMYLKNSSATWRFMLQGNELRFFDGTADRLTIEPSGEVGIGTVNPTSELEVVGDIEIPAANNYSYSSARTEHMTVHNSAFTVASTNTNVQAYRNISGLGSVFLLRTQGGTNTNDAFFAAPVNLPDGAVVTEVAAHFFDSDLTYNVTLELKRQLYNGSATGVLGTVATTGNPGQSTVTDNTITNAIVDNSNYAYFLQFETKEASPASLGLYNVRITYTVDRVD